MNQLWQDFGNNLVVLQITTPTHNLTGTKAKPYKLSVAQTASLELLKYLKVILSNLQSH